jgi:hypothetical protein
VAKSFAIEQTGDLARGRYTRLIDELNELINQVDTVSLEIDTYPRRDLGRDGRAACSSCSAPAASTSTGRRGAQMWPFDGEYWRDELGFYRQQVTSQCGR